MILDDGVLNHDGLNLNQREWRESVAEVIPNNIAVVIPNNIAVVIPNDIAGLDMDRRSGNTLCDYGVYLIVCGETLHIRFSVSFCLTCWLYYTLYTLTRCGAARSSDNIRPVDIVTTGKQFFFGCCFVFVFVDFLLFYVFFVFLINTHDDFLNKRYVESMFL